MDIAARGRVPGDECCRMHQPLIPPVVRPAMKYRWKMKKMMMIGIVAMTDPEMSMS